MPVAFPEEIEQFEEFLRSDGLTCTARETHSQHFGNKVLEYRDDRVSVQIVSDRGYWQISIRDMDSQQIRPHWDIELIRVLLESRHGNLTEILDREFRPIRAGQMDQNASYGRFVGQLEFAKANWAAIIDCFSDANRTQTGTTLEILGQERAKRIFAIWPSKIEQFEPFMQTMGLTCQCRTTPNGMPGVGKMQYANSEVIVRIMGKPGWHVELADAALPDKWYDVRLLDVFLLGDIKCEIGFSEWFDFLKTNWSAIVTAFDADHREQTHTRLDQFAAARKKKPDPPPQNLELNMEVNSAILVPDPSQRAKDGWLT